MIVVVIVNMFFFNVLRRGLSIQLILFVLSLDQDDSPMDEMIETIASFILSGGGADDDEEANAIAREIYDTCCLQDEELGAGTSRWTCLIAILALICIMYTKRCP